MPGDDSVIELLNDVLTAELTAINQYFLDARMCHHWGYERMADHFQEESVGEMRDAQALIDRILYLDGLPNLQRLGALRVGETVEEKLTLALALEREAIDRLNRGIALCTERADNGSRTVLEGILVGEEHHVDWLDGQLHALGETGAGPYLAEQLYD